MTSPSVNLIRRDFTSVCLVDLSAIFTRNYRGAGIGAPPNAGADRTLAELKEIASEVDHVITCLDWPPYKRRDRFEGYKAHREERPVEEKMQMRALLKELERLGFRLARAEGYEADDIIATLARHYAEWCPDVRIFGGDKDLAQLITGRVIQYVPANGRVQIERRDRQGCRDKFGCWPEQMPLLQALIGDKSDNVPGVEGVGKDRAKKVIQALEARELPATIAGLAEYMAGSTDGAIYWRAIADDWENLRLSLELVTLDKSVPIDADGYLHKHAPAKAANDVDDGIELDGFENNRTPPVEDDGVAPVPPGWLEDNRTPTPAPRSVERPVTAEQIDRALEKLPPIIGKDPKADEFLKKADEERKADRAAREAQDEEREQERLERVADAVQKSYPRTKRPDALTTAGYIVNPGTMPGSPLAPKTEPIPVEELISPPGGPMPEVGSHNGRVPGVGGAPPAAPPPPAGPGLTKAMPRGAPPAPFLGEVQSAALAVSADKYGLTGANLQPMDLRAVWTVSTWIAQSGLYKAFDTPHKVASVILRGREMGLDAGVALAGMHVIEGKPTLSADLIRALAERDPNCEYFMLVSADDKHATWETKHKKHPRPTTFTYTIDQARLIPSYWVKDRWGKDGNWVTRTQEMLTKTAGSKLARLVYPQATLGLYCPEEMGSFVDTIGEAA